MMFGKLKEFARSSPALAALLRELIGYLLFGGSETAKKNLLTGWQALDTDGDGIPDFLEQAKERLSTRPYVNETMDNTASDRMVTPRIESGVTPRIESGVAQQTDAGHAARVEAEERGAMERNIVADLRKRGLADEVIRKLGYQI